MLFYYLHDNIESLPLCDGIKGHLEKYIRAGKMSTIGQPENHEIEKWVFGGGFIAFLTKDGKVGRFPYQINDEKFPLLKFNTEDQPPSKRSPPILSLRPSNMVRRDYRRYESLRNALIIQNAELRNSFLTDSNPFFISRQNLAQVRNPTRETNVVVPDELIERVESILQGRPRSSIIRELQRSNLDVNVAVNMLLNQEENDTHDETDESSTINSFNDEWEPQNDIRLLEPVQGNTSQGFIDTNEISDSNTIPVVQNNPSAPPVTINVEDNKDVEISSLEIECGKVTWWPQDNNIVFEQIGSMFSDLIAVDNRGILYQWPWESSVPVSVHERRETWGPHLHRKAEILDLAHERIKILSCSCARSSAILYSNKVSSWFDSCLWGVTEYERTLVVSGTPASNPPVKLSVCDIYTSVVLKDGTLWWWGILPSLERSRVLGSLFEKTKPKVKTSSNYSCEISVGSIVTFRSSSILQPGTLAFYYSNDCLKMGILSDSFSTYKSTARFKICKDRPDALEYSFISSDENSKNVRRVCKSKLKRKLKHVPESSEEEEWPLSNVVFLEERIDNLGTVMKIDGDNVLVKFNSDGNSSDEKESLSYDGESLKNCRILNIKDLKLVNKQVKSVCPAPCIQLNPKLICGISKPSAILALKCYNDSLFLFIHNNCDGKSHVRNIIPGCKPSSAPIFQVNGQISKNISDGRFNPDGLQVSGKTLILESSEHGCCILNKDYNSQYRLYSMPSISSIKSVFFSEISARERRYFMVMLQFDKMCCRLFPINDAGFQLISSDICTDTDFLNKRYYSNQNIFHFLCFQATTMEISEKSSMSADPLLKLISMLQLMNNTELKKKLLLERDLDGMTPFLFAVQVRAYRAALSIYESLKRDKMFLDDEDSFRECLFPRSLSYQNNPLYMLCTNECCSFTWTGKSHVHQDVYECKTCGLTESLCCCTECAFTCHSGHDCVLKRCSPTAYCDCWQMCCCKSLFPGNVNDRKELFETLVGDPIFRDQVADSCEHIILFVIKTLARQNKEQKSYLNISSTNPQGSNANISDCGSSVITRREFVLGKPIKTISPPIKFLGFALKVLLGNMTAVCSIFSSRTIGESSYQAFDDTSEIHDYFSSAVTQFRGKVFDCFLYNLLAKCDKSYSRKLINTLLQNQDSNCSGHSELYEQVIRRFVRSCARIYMVIVSLMSPFFLENVISGHTQKNYKFRLYGQLMSVFASFPVVSARELGSLALSVSAPLLTGAIPSSKSSFCLLSNPTDILERVSPIFTSVPASSKESKNNIFVDSRSYPSTNDLYVIDESHQPVEVRNDDEEMISEENLELGTEFLNYQQSDDDLDYSDSDTAMGSQIEQIYTEGGTGSGNHGEGESGSQTSSIVPSSDDETDFTEVRRQISSQSELDPIRVQESQNRESRFRLINFGETRLRRRVMGSSNRQFLPTHLQWAVRDMSGNEQFRLDPTPLTSVWHPRGNHSDLANVGNESSNKSNKFVSNTVATARTVGILIQTASDIIEKHNLFVDLDSYGDFLSKSLGPLLVWLFDTIETVESLLRLGHYAIISKNDTNPISDDYELVFGSSHDEGGQTTVSRNDRSSTSTSSDRAQSEFLSSLLSSGRLHCDEHGDVLPWLDVSSYKHVAYILDAVLYCFKNHHVGSSENDFFHSTVNQPKDGLLIPDRQKFYKRTNSTLGLGKAPKDPLITPLKESLPLAAFPHILKPTSSRKQLFNLTDDDTLRSSWDVINISSRSSHPLIYSSNFDTDDFLSRFAKSNYSYLLYRWKTVINIFSEIFIDDFGAEPRSLLRETCSYVAKESFIRSTLDFLRYKSSNELAIDQLDRSREIMIPQVIKIFNRQFHLRMNTIKSGGCPFSRMKVQFKGEPGEGNGVTRNFFSVVSEAFMSDEPLPEGLFQNEVNDNRDRDGPLLGNTQNVSTQSRPALARLLVRLRRLATYGHNTPTQTLFRSVDRRTHLIQPNSDLPVSYIRRIESDGDTRNSFTLEEITRALSSRVNTNSEDVSVRNTIITQLNAILERHEINHPNVVVEGLLQLSPDVVSRCLQDEGYLIVRANSILQLYGDFSPSTNSFGNNDADLHDEPRDLTKLFFQPGKPGFYFPLAGTGSRKRLNVFKNIGRFVGLAIFFNEIMPLNLCRPVVKYLLGRQISFHDFAFYDPVQFESIRQMLLESGSSNSFKETYNLFYSVNITLGGVEQSYDLTQDGSQIEVTKENVYDYVQRYVEYKLVLSVKKELESMKEGLHEVLPKEILDCLTPEDFRLLVNGVCEVSVKALKSIVKFYDETGGQPKNKVEEFKDWFWAVVEGFNMSQRHELMMFWTSSPYLSASRNQSKPCITLKSRTDPHLPTSNTCIMKLYLPMYSSKSILKSKLLMAIKTKTFGFV